MEPAVEIKLTRGMTATIDESDASLVAGWNWYAVNWSKPHQHPAWYAVGRPIGSSGNVTPMHRLLAGAPRGVKVDHENGNGLDNRRSNLRTATQSQNSANQTSPVRSATGFRGVSKMHKSGKAHFLVKSTRFGYVGIFDTPEEAAHAYDDAARKTYGPFARLNFPREGENGANRLADRLTFGASCPSPSPGRPRYTARRRD